MFTRKMNSLLLSILCLSASAAFAVEEKKVDESSRNKQALIRKAAMCAGVVACIGGAIYLEKQHDFFSSAWNNAMQWLSEKEAVLTAEKALKDANKELFSTSCGAKLLLQQRVELQDKLAALENGQTAELVRQQLQKLNDELSTIWNCAPDSDEFMTLIQEGISKINEQYVKPISTEIVDNVCAGLFYCRDKVRSLYS
jgi:hypothetical protein